MDSYIEKQRMFDREHRGSMFTRACDPPSPIIIVIDKIERCYVVMNEDDHQGYFITFLDK